MVDSLWGAEFNIEETPKKIKKIKEKLDDPKDISKVLKSTSSKISIQEKLDLIIENVYRILGKYKEDTITIRTKEELVSYIDAAIENGEIAIDTETNNSLDPITCKLMGPCIYTPGQKNAYIPLNHVDIDTRLRLPNQLTEEDVKEQFQRLVNTKIIMHNGKFDYQVIKCTTGEELNIYWDTMLAARLIDENEPSARLKDQYIDKIDPSIEKYDIEYLFEGIEYAIVPPEVFALYAATDAYMTYKLYKYQLERFETDPELKGSYHILKDVEVPLIPVVANMELRGVGLDKEYAQRLSVKYNKLLTACEEKIQAEFEIIKPKIDAWRLTPDANFQPLKKNGVDKAKSKSEKLPENINSDSPTQLAILFYDVLKFPQVSKKSPRGTGVDELEALAEKTKSPLCKLILEKRGLSKLLNTFIDKLPQDVNESDGKIHASFNQLGTDTGRFSSSNPNLQQLPRDAGSIRMMFRADPGKIMVGSDFSAQEVRMGAFSSQDPSMIDAYVQNKDLYAQIASVAFDSTYDNCLEFYPEGTKIIYEGKEVICGKKTHTNVEGKKRRQSAKPICIGSLYQRGVKSISEQIGKSLEETQEIMDKFYAGFPRLKQWMDEQKEFVRKNGYVDNWNGRRRRLPEAQLPKYTVKLDENAKTNFNPLLHCNVNSNNELILKYQRQLETVQYRKEYEAIKANAEAEGVEIINNNAKIAQCERQSVNYPCQSGGADVTKLAMLNIDKDPELKALGFELLLPVHDELIGQCPLENADKVAELLPKLMVQTAVNAGINVPMSCDPTVESCWYEEEIMGKLNSKFGKLLVDMDKEEAYNIIYKEFSELTPEQIYGVLSGEVNTLYPDRR